MVCHYVVNVRFMYEGREESREFELYKAPYIRAGNRTSLLGIGITDGDQVRTVEVRLVMSPILWTGSDGTRYRDQCYKWIKGNETRGERNHVQAG